MRSHNERSSSFFSFVARRVVRRRERTRLSPFLFALLRGVAFFFCRVRRWLFLCERTQTRNEKVHVRVRIIGSLAAAFGVKNINTARANAIEVDLTTREKGVSVDEKILSTKKRGLISCLLL